MNPNRDLEAEQVEHLVEKNLPHLASGLCRDRAWVWLVTGGKPPEADRKLLVELGFGFTPKPHVCPSGDTSHWFHACGGFVKRGGRSRTRRTSKSGEKTETKTNDPMAALMALAGV